MAPSTPDSGETIEILLRQGDPVSLLAEYDLNTCIGATYDWDFGDGTQATGSSVTHTFDESGVYTANLAAKCGRCVNINPVLAALLVRVPSVDIILQGLSEADEVNIGGILGINSDDDNNNGKLDFDSSEVHPISAENDLIPLEVHLTNIGGTGQVMLTYGAGIAIYDDSLKTNPQLVSGTTWNLATSTPPSQLWVEGTQTAALRSVEIKVEFQLNSFLIDDSVNLGVLEPDVLVHSADAESERIAPVTNTFKTIHVVSARDQNDIILVTDPTMVDPDLNQIRNRLTWKASAGITLSSPIAGDPGTVSVNSNLYPGQMIPINLTIDGQDVPVLRHIKTWIISAVPSTPVITCSSPPCNPAPPVCNVPRSIPTQLNLSVSFNIVSELTIINLGTGEGYSFPFTIQPTQLFFDRATMTTSPHDVPDLTGPPQSQATPPAATGQCTIIWPGSSLSDQVNARWDVTRQVRLDAGPYPYLTNEKTKPDYPADLAIGNDDSSATNEDNDPYTPRGNPPAFAIILDHDNPSIVGFNNRGSLGDTYHRWAHFRALVRLNLRQKWFNVVSPVEEWKLQGTMEKISEGGCDINGNGSTTDDVWINAGSVSDLTNAPWLNPTCVP